ncbi:glycosyltransferase family 2 protein [Microbacteriaceae bacterium VKM Ac-2855]|nr:glycosyltransferase family 2 protein [Microbacteriaceae bacterium VKM Ac-2855]
METPGVTVVIPVKDDAEHLERCLAALALQTHPPVEIVIVDDSSIDESAHVATAFGARVITHDGAGIPASSACGYDAARSAIIARLDADSVPPPDWIERLLLHFERPEVDAVSGPGRFVGYGSGRQLLARVVYMDAYFVLMGSAMGHWPLFGSNLAMRRTAWSDVARWVHRADARMHDDVDLSLHLGLRHRIVFDPTLVVGVSARPFADPLGMLRRYQRALHTLRHHGAAGVPMLRWRRRLRLRWRAARIAEVTPERSAFRRAA